MPHVRPQAVVDSALACSDHGMRDADNAALHGQVVALIDLIRVNGVLRFAINIKPQDER